MREFIKTKCHNVQVSDGLIQGELPPSLFAENARLQRKLNQRAIACKILARSFVVSLVSQYDSFLGGLVRALFYLKPELLNSSERALSFKELSQFSSLDDAREFIVEKEVETLVRKSHSEQFDWMQNKFSIQLKTGLDSWPAFIEISERRNLFVHCDSKISSQYIDVCRSNGVDCDHLELGSELPVNRPYFTQAYECIFEIGVKLAHVLWRKLAPDQRDVADKNLNQIGLDLLSQGRYKLARNLFDFGTSVLKQWGSDADRRVFIINRAQAYKWMDDDDGCRKILAAEDWSAVEDKFSMAVAILRDEFSQAIILMKRVGHDGLAADAYRGWPIFKKFRELPEFKDAYKEIFGVDFAALAPHDQTITFKLPINPTSDPKAVLPSSESSKAREADVPSEDDLPPKSSTGPPSVQ
jgi:hypothetical protein